MNAEARFLLSLQKCVRLMYRPFMKLDHALTMAVLEADPSLDVRFTDREQELVDQALLMMEEVGKSLRARKR